MNRQAILENEILLLRPLREEDFKDLQKAASDPLIWEQHPAERYKIEVFKSFFQESLDTKGALVIIDQKTNEIIGSSRFNIIPGKENAIEIGWSFLSRAYWGGKFNRSFKYLMIEHALKSVDSVLFYVDLENIRSQYAMQKLGAQLLDDKATLEYKKKNREHKIFIVNKENFNQKTGL